MIDSGSGTTRSGLSGSSHPNLAPTIAGVLRRPFVGTKEGKSVYTGEDFMKYRGQLDRKYPVEFGLVVNWEQMEAIWRSTFVSVLGEAVDLSEISVVVTENVLNPVSSRERLVRIMLESLGVKEVAVENRHVLALKQTGRDTGAVLSIGAEVTICAPVYKGFAVTNAIFRMDKGGRFVGEYLQKTIAYKGFSFTTMAEVEMLHRIKEQLCYVSMDFEQEGFRLEQAKEDLDKSFELPDGNSITLGSERYHAPEILFTPGLNGSESVGLVDLVFNAVWNCNRIDDKTIDAKQMREEMFGNIILAGGCTLFPGFAERLKLDLTPLVADGMDVNIIALPQRRHLAWIGASILATQGKLEFVSVPPGS